MSCNEVKTLKDLNKFLNERGMNFFELIEMTGRYNSSLLMLTDEHARRSVSYTHLGMLQTV